MRSVETVGTGPTTLYYPVDARENDSIRKELARLIEEISGLRLFLEQDYFGKFYVFRNWYQTYGLMRQAEIVPWNNFGVNSTPPGYYDFLYQFHDRHVRGNYRRIPVRNIKCPNGSASTGVCYTVNGWIYRSSSADIWPWLLEGIEEIETVFKELAPSWIDLFNPMYHNRALSALSLDCTVIRTEGGPTKIRWAQNHSKHSYVLERSIVVPMQDGSWNHSPLYIGKSSHSKNFGEVFDHWEGRPVVATHGDDWIAALGDGKFASGDWSEFDHHVTGKQIVMSRKALSDVLFSKTAWSEDDDKLLRSLTYLASKGSVLWPWTHTPKGWLPQPGIVPLTGHVRSGSGDFVYHNNAINQAGLRSIIGKGFKGWKVFVQKAASLLGWSAKRSAQIASKEGFVSCRCVHLREEDWRPIPCVSSVVRNWVRPSYDPMEHPQNFRISFVIRLRELARTLSHLPGDEFESTMKPLLRAALESGVQNPAGSEYSNSELSRWHQRLIGEYGMSSYLNM
jgi:hypothetical protein